MISRGLFPVMQDGLDQLEVKLKDEWHVQAKAVNNTPLATQRYFSQNNLNLHDRCFSMIWLDQIIFPINL